MLIQSFVDIFWNSLLLFTKQMVIILVAMKVFLNPSEHVVFMLSNNNTSLVK